MIMAHRCQCFRKCKNHTRPINEGRFHHKHQSCNKACCVFVCTEYLSGPPSLTSSVCDSDLRLSLRPRGPWRPGPLLQEEPVCQHRSGLPTSAGGPKPPDSPAGEADEEAGSTCPPLHLLCKWQLRSKLKVNIGGNIECQGCQTYAMVMVKWSSLWFSDVQVRKSGRVCDFRSSSGLALSHGGSAGFIHM